MVGLLLILSVPLTGLTGLIQAKLDLHGFVPHRYFAYTTLFLASVHVILNFGALTKYVKTKLRRKEPERWEP